MLETIITSKTRVKLLLKFFLNANTRSYLRNLEAEFGESSNAIRLELNRFEEAGMLDSEKEGNRKYFKANQKHPLFTNLQDIVKKFVGIDNVIENIVVRLGNVERVYLEGSLAQGKDSQIIDLLLVGDSIERKYLVQLIEKVEPLLAKKVRYVCLEEREESNYLASKEVEPLLIWHK